MGLSRLVGKLRTESLPVLDLSGALSVAKKRRGWDNRGLLFLTLAKPRLFVQSKPTPLTHVVLPDTTLIIGSIRDNAKFMGYAAVQELERLLREGRRSW